MSRAAATRKDTETKMAGQGSPGPPLIVRKSDDQNVSTASMPKVTAVVSLKV